MVSAWSKDLKFSYLLRYDEILGDVNGSHSHYKSRYIAYL